MKHYIYGKRVQLSMVALPEWCPAYNSLKKDPLSGEEVFCICKKPDSGELMVGCDGCDDWFHFSCLRVPQKFNELVFSFYCPYCQCGVTGPGSRSRNLPKTLWRRKCRVLECYKPCSENSKYCSEEHALEYMRSLLDRVESRSYDTPTVLRQMLQNTDLASFQKMGQNDVPTPSEDLAPGLLDDDKRLRELSSQIDDIRKQAKPEVEAQFQKLANYVAWNKSVNAQLFGSQNSELASKASRAQKRKKKSVKPKAICGYHANFEITCSPEEFVSQYNEDIPELHSVCCKLRCARHLDWAGIQENALQFQLETLESSLERLTLLLKIRQDQLKVQFYKKLSHAEKSVC